MNVSIKQAMEQKAALEAQAKTVHEQIAQDLTNKIPLSCEALADAKGWIKKQYGDTLYWTMPDWLGHLVDNTMKEACNSFRVTQDQLSEYGCESFEQLFEKLSDLERAWAGLVRIEIWKGELPHRVTLGFYAVEYETK